MTQVDPNTPYTEQKSEYREEIHVMGAQLSTTVERLLHEGSVRRIIIKHEGHTMLEIPLAVGVVGVLVAPLLAAVGAIGAAVTNCTIEVIRTEPANQTSAPSLQGTGQKLCNAISAMREWWRKNPSARFVSNNKGS